MSGTRGSSVTSRRVQAPTKEEIEAKEWKFTGYRGFSQFVSSDNDFFVIRRFGNLNARVILLLQDEISQLEQELADLDDSQVKREGPDIHNGTFRGEIGSERWNLLRKEIYVKLKDYNEFIFFHTEMRKRGPVPEKDITSLKHWFHNHTNAIHDDETHYINNTTDLVSLVPKSKTPLRRLFERSLHFRIFRPWRVKHPNLEYHDPNHEFYSSDERVDSFVSVTIVIVGLVMLVAPLWILNFIHSTIQSLAVITSFIVLFICLVSYATVAKPFETLGATAAYTAVMMVFLQIGNNAPAA